MGSKVKVYVNNGQITRTADPLNNKFCLGKTIYTLLTNILPESDDVGVSFVNNMLMRDV